KIDRDIAPKPALSHFFGNETAFERSIVERPASSHDLRAEHLKRPGVELPLWRLHGPKNRQPFHVAVVENFDDLRLLVAKAEVGFVDDESAAEGIEDVENRRYRRSPTREERLVAERPDCEERAGLA